MEQAPRSQVILKNSNYIMATTINNSTTLAINVKSADNF